MKETEMTPELKAALAKASPDLDVFAAVARGELTTRQAATVLRRRAKAARLPKPTRHFKSLFSEFHAARGDRRAAMAINRKRGRENAKAVAAYRERLGERVFRSTEADYTSDLEWATPLGMIPIVEGVDFDAADAWLVQAWSERLPKPVTVGVPGIMFKAAWPKDRKQRTAMKKAQREMYRKGIVGGQPMPFITGNAKTVAP